jgi:hypothetical protein
MVLVRVPLRQRDASVDDDRTVPVPAPTIQLRDLSSRFRLVDYETAPGIVYI